MMPHHPSWSAPPYLTYLEAHVTFLRIRPPWRAYYWIVGAFPWHVGVVLTFLDLREVVSMDLGGCYTLEDSHMMFDAIFG
jgi:hypothetical protein